MEGEDRSRKTKRELVKGGAPSSDPRSLIEWTDEWTGRLGGLAWSGPVRGR
jgi:hypothetical protein